MFHLWQGQLIWFVLLYYFSSCIFVYFLCGTLWYSNTHKKHKGDTKNTLDSCHVLKSVYKKSKHYAGLFRQVEFLRLFQQIELPPAPSRGGRERIVSSGFLFADILGIFLFPSSESLSRTCFGRLGEVSLSIVLKFVYSFSGIFLFPSSEGLGEVCRMSFTYCFSSLTSLRLPPGEGENT